MKVFMLPTFYKANKYGQALVNSIRQTGIDLHFIFGDERYFPLFKVTRTAGLPQVVHLHWTDTYTIKTTWKGNLVASGIYFFSLLFLKALGVKIVWTVHDYINVEERHAQFEIVVRKVTARLVDAIIVHSEVAKQELAKLYKLSERKNRKTHVIPHGHYLDQYPNTISRAEARKQLGLNEDTFVFGFIGYIRPYKGIMNLIEAFSQLEGRHLNLLIAGRAFDPLFGKAVKEAAKTDRRIHLNLEFIADEELQIFLNAVDVVVFPFVRSLTSGSLLLAMSFGKAVVISNCTPMGDILASNGGLIYASAEPEALIQALCRIQSMDVVSMGQRNLERAQTFDWQSIAKATIQVYQEVLLN